MPKQDISVDEEQARFDATVKEIEEWWATPRQAHLKRPYSAARIASMRGSGFLKQSYASSAMAVKLWNQLNAHRENGTAEMTFGVTDPIIAAQMAKHCLSLYVSGALCGFSEVDVPGMDHADYPWDTVPKAVDRIFRSQQWHDQRQHHFRMLHSKEERAALENWDYLTPIVADGDMGFNGMTATVKMTKLFVEAGVAMFHLDDLAVGKKKFTIGEGRTIVPFSEYEDRITAARMQIDIMGAETMILCRCDTDHAEFITDTIDPRDHAYIQGATVPGTKSLVETLNAAAESGTGTANLLALRKQWLADARVATFDEAVQALATEDEYKAYTAQLPRFASLKDRRALAKETVAKDVFFDWELSRAREGQYLLKSSVSGILERALAVAPLGDVTWARMDMPNWADIVAFHEGFRAVHPERVFAFGYTGDFDYPNAGFSAQAVKTLPADLAKLGIVWQVQPIWGLQGLNYATDKFAAMWRERGIEGYVEEVQKPALGSSPMTDGFEKPSYSGAYLADAFFDTIAARDKKENVWTKLVERRER